MLTNAKDYQLARNYWKVLKKRLKDEGAEPVTNCNQLKFSQTENPSTFEENKSAAQRGGRIAGNARKELEAEIGYSVISNKAAPELNTIVTNLIENAGKE